MCSQPSDPMIMFRNLYDVMLTKVSATKKKKFQTQWDHQLAQIERLAKSATQTGTSSNHPGSPVKSEDGHRCNNGTASSSHSDLSFTKPTTSTTTTIDNTWICIFCQQKSHHRGMGDLFGPYFIPVESSSKDPHHHHLNSPTSSRENSKEAQQEVWFHEDCVVWTNGIYLVGNRLKNLDEVIKDCTGNVCCSCGLKGASLGCLFKACTPRYHYLCAKEKGCGLIEDNFSMHCPKHKLT